jgi:hypothetical protein
VKIEIAKMVLFLILSLTFSLLPTLAQDSEIICEADVIVQADDWLSKLAEKFLGDVLAFPSIVQATNAKSAVDRTYTKIENPDVIELGWKLCVPDTQTAQELLTVTSAATAEKVNEESSLGIPAPRLVEHNQEQFIWEWEEVQEVKGKDWYFDIKIYNSANDDIPYDTLVADPKATTYLNGRWYSDLSTNFQGCSYWVVQIAERDTSGNFEKHISPESERLKVGPCQNTSSPVR